MHIKGSALQVKGIYIDKISLSVLDRLDGNEGFIVPLSGKLHPAIDHGKKRMVFPHSNITAGVMNRTSLSDDDVSGFDNLAPVELYTQSFAF
jgi:hypothetical protein